MCEPTTIMAISAAVSVAAAGYSAHQQNEAGKANQQISENNARLARDDAAAAQAMGDRESQQQAWRTRAVLGQQRAAIASNGIDASIGTPSELLGEVAMFGEAEQQNIRLNAARQAWGFNAQATNYTNQGKQARWSGKSQAAGTVLSGLAQAGSSYGSYRAAGGGA